MVIIFRNLRLFQNKTAICLISFLHLCRFPLLLGNTRNKHINNLKDLKISKKLNLIAKDQVDW